MAMTLNVGGQSVNLDATAAAVTLTVEGQTIELSATSASVEIQTYVPGSAGADGTDGAPGAVGPPGGSGFTLPTEISIGGNRAVATVSEFAVYADSLLGLPAVGISTGAVVGGNDVTLQSGSKMAVTGAGWAPGSPVFLSTNGTLTQTEPVAGLSQVLGIAHDAETILIEIVQPITLVT